MANHCYNYAFFEGSKEDIIRASQAISNAIGDDEYLWWESFKKVFGDKYEYSSEDVYAEFGSKWFDCDMSTNEETMTIMGDSAWSPVSPFFQKLCETFNLSCSSEYEEGGCDFGGWFDCNKKGEITKNVETTYRLYRESEEPGYLLESIIEDAKDGVWESFKEFKETISEKELNILNVRSLEKIRNVINKL